MLTGLGEAAIGDAGPLGADPDCRGRRRPRQRLRQHQLATLSQQRVVGLAGAAQGRAFGPTSGERLLRQVRAVAARKMVRARAPFFLRIGGR